MPADHSDEISLFAVGALLVRSRWLIARWALAGGVAALAAVWTRPAIYRASASFVPESGESPRSGLSSLASSLGVTVPTGAPSLSPDFYLALLNSREILEQIALDTLTVPEFSGKRVALEDMLKVGAGSAKLRQEAAVKELRRRIATSIDKATGIVTVSVATPWPTVSLTVVTDLVNGVNAFNQRSRRDEAAAERRFIEGRLVQATAELRAAEDALQRFLQSNRATAAPDLRFAQDRLERNVSLRQQVFASLTQAYDDVRMRELRDTPVISMVDEPSVAARPEPRGRGVVTLVGVFLGAAIGALVAAMRRLVATRRAVGDPAAEEFLMTIGEVKGNVRRGLKRFSGRASA